MGGQRQWWWRGRGGLRSWRFPLLGGPPRGHGRVYPIKGMLLRKAWPTDVPETPKHLNYLSLLIKVNTLLMVLINSPINPACVMVLLCI